MSAVIFTVMLLAVTVNSVVHLAIVPRLRRFVASVLALPVCVVRGGRTFLIVNVSLLVTVLLCVYLPFFAVQPSTVNVAVTVLNWSLISIPSIFSRSVSIFSPDYFN